MLKKKMTFHIKEQGGGPSLDKVQEGEEKIKLDHLTQTVKQFSPLTGENLMSSSQILFIYIYIYQKNAVSSKHFLYIQGISLDETCLYLCHQV